MHMFIHIVYTHYQGTGTLNKNDPCSCCAGRCDSQDVECVRLSSGMSSSRCALSNNVFSTCVRPSACKIYPHSETLSCSDGFVCCGPAFTQWPGNRHRVRRQVRPSNFHGQATRPTQPDLGRIEFVGGKPVRPGGVKATALLGSEGLYHHGLVSSVILVEDKV